MNEKQTPAPASGAEKTVRPTKKQKELLSFIEAFITEHGYSPSYREIMAGLNYTSVATVSLHVNSLIKRGHLRKRDRSARSLEVVNAAPGQPAQVTSNQIAPGEEKWLVEKVEHAFQQVESKGGQLAEGSLDQLHVLVGALKVLGLEGASQSFMPRLTALKQRQSA
jgi:repressor LexA